MLLEKNKINDNRIKHVPPNLSELRNKSTKSREQLMINLRKQSKIVENTKNIIYIKHFKYNNYGISFKNRHLDQNYERLHFGFQY